MCMPSEDSTQATRNCDRWYFLTNSKSSLHNRLVAFRTVCRQHAVVMVLDPDRSIDCTETPNWLFHMYICLWHAKAAESPWTEKMIGNCGSLGFFFFILLNIYYDFMSVWCGCLVLGRDKLADSYFIIATINCPIRIQCRYISNDLPFVYIQLREFLYVD